jgi:16S rRNA (uracil1498-N3)-methyltransferase
MQGGHRFLLAPSAWSSGVLEGDEARHLAQVLRIRAGEGITVFDGGGRRAPARVLAVSRDRVELELGEVVPPVPATPAITLAQAVPKGKNMDLIVQKAVEMGVSRIQPLVTRHTIVQPGEGKADKWRRTALEACKQCGQDLLPEICEPLTFTQWLAAGCVDGLRLIASLAPGSRPLREVLRDHPGTVAATLLIGPEGDFSAEETTAALGTGFVPVSFGQVVLRVETASLYGISALRYEFGA